jgi:hypothetical protein
MLMELLKNRLRFGGILMFVDRRTQDFMIAYENPIFIPKILFGLRNLKDQVRGRAKICVKIYKKRKYHI